MPDFTPRNRVRDKRQIPRIEEKEAARIFAHLECLTEDSSDLPQELRTQGFAQFLAQLQEPTLQLAVQPDSWGERTRARLVSVVIETLRGIPADRASIGEIVDVANIVTPCFLLELGRRKHHITVEFPRDPCHPGAVIDLRVAPSLAMHSITAECLSRLVTEVGEELVGLCYFGDEHTQEIIEAVLSRNDTTTNLKTRPCHSTSSSPREKP